MNSMEQYITEQGVALTLDANSPFSLSGSGDIWFVASGRIDVFLQEDGENESERTPVLSVEAGGAAFGHPKHPGASLLCVGTPGTRAYRISRSVVDELDPVFAAKLVNGYLNDLSAALARSAESLPDVQTQLDKGVHHELTQLDLARAKDETLWIRHTSEGQTLFMGMEDIKAGQWYPLPAAGWIQALNDLSLESLSTEDLLGSDSFWPAFDYGYHVALNCLNLGAAFASADRLVALREKTAADVRVTRGGLLKLASIMDSSIEASGIHDTENNLVRACSVVARKLGVDFSQLPTPVSGNTVEEVAESANMRARRVLLRQGWHKQDGGPLVGFLGKNKQPVALLPVSARSYSLHIPETGETTPVTKELLEELEPVAYTFYRPLPDKKLGMRDILTFGLRGCRKDLAWVAGLGATIGLIGLVTPLLTRTIFNDVIPGADKDRLMQIVAILIGFTMTSLLFEAAKSISMLRAKVRADHNLETAIWERLLRLPVSFFRKYTAGDLAQRANALGAVQQMLSGASLSSMFSALFSLIYLAQLFYFDMKLATVALLIVFISAAMTAVVSIIQIHYQRKAVSMAGRISGQTLQFITGVSKLRASGAEDRALMQWAENFAEQRRISYTLSSVGNAFTAFNTLFATIGSALIYLGVIYFERENDMDMGTFMAFWAAFGGLQGGILGMVAAATKIFKAVPYFERLKPILKEETESAEATGDPGEIKGNIEMANLNFRYDPDGPLILKNVSLKIEPGQFVAITGPSGSGKTTLLRLLLGFEKPESGSILYENQDISQVDAAKVRKQMGVVLQNGGLMPGDIFTNIIGASTLTLDDAWQAAEMAGFAEDIKAMPMGMHTVISEGASTLSGGQKQRLIIARALARRPNVLLFDEATSALDNRTQEIVTQSLNQLPVTRIVIAHRLSTIQEADVILVLKDGEVVESGNYEELMSAKGVFHDLAIRQMT